MVDSIARARSAAAVRVASGAVLIVAAVALLSGCGSTSCEDACGADACKSDCLSECQGIEANLDDDCEDEFEAIKECLEENECADDACDADGEALEQCSKE